MLRKSLLAAFWLLGCVNAGAQDAAGRETGRIEGLLGHQLAVRRMDARHDRGLVFRQNLEAIGRIASIVGMFVVAPAAGVDRVAGNRGLVGIAALAAEVSGLDVHFGSVRAIDDLSLRIAGGTSRGVPNFGIPFGSRVPPGMEMGLG